MTINEQHSLDQAQTLLGEMPAADLPVALFPVRLETRFMEQDQKSLLCVRIFPDDVHVETHESGMTEDEERWGRHLWEQAWRSGGDPETERALRDELAGRFGPGRAAWIARRLTPVNPDARPSTPVPETEPLPTAPEFPDVPRQEDGWTRPPVAHALPDRWVALGYRGDERVLASVGLPIPDKLAAGPDPQAPAPNEPDDAVLQVDDGMRWMVDFERAVRDGMALRIPVSSEDAGMGYDRLVVLGISSDADGDGAADEIEKLFEAQRYTDSLAFVRQGTPSNNTGEAKSGYAGTEPEQWNAFGGSRSGEAPTPKSNRLLAAEALGLDPSVFERIPFAGESEQADARAMNVALWPATWGYFLRHVVAGAVSDEDIERARRHFLDFVRARGPLPVLRIGRQPYGLLPATALDRYGPSEDDAFGSRGLDVLRALRSRWRNAASRLPHARPFGRLDEMEQALADILGQSAVADHVQARIAIDGSLYGLRLAEGLETSPSRELMTRKSLAAGLLRELGAPVDVPGASLVFTEPVFRLPDSLVIAGEAGRAADSDSIRKLLTATVAALREETLDRPSILYLLLRHAMLLAYAETAYRIQVREGLLQPGGGVESGLVDILSVSGDGTRDDTTLNVSPGSISSRPAEHTVTPLRLLDDVAPGIGEGPLREMIHELDGSAHPDAALLEEMRTSIAHLVDLPAERLDLLLRETLDLASHRLDAWITSLATARLHRLRKNRPTGLLVGGYGWVENLRKATGRSSVETPPPGEELPAGDVLQVAGDNRGFVAAPSLSHASTAAILRSGYAAYADGSDSAPFAIDLSSNRVRLAEWLLEGVRRGQPLGALLGYRFERSLRENGFGHFIRPFRLVAPFGELYEAMSEKSALEEELNTLRNRHAQEAALAQSLLDALKSEIAGLTSQIVSKTSERSSLERLQPSPMKPTAQLQAEINTLTAQQNEKQAEVNQLAKLVGTGFGGAVFKPKFEKALGELNAISNQLNALKTVLQRQQQIESLASQIAALTSQRNTKQSQLEQKTSEVDAIKARQQQERQALQNRIDEVQRRIDELGAAQRARFTATASLQAMEEIEAQHVVDGLALVRKRQAGRIPFGRLGLPEPNSIAAGALGVLLDALGAAVDAVSDLVTAESVYQLAQGNELRAGATLDAVARGETPPPEPEFVRTPRTLSPHAHRVAVVLPTTPEAPAAWTTDSFQRRAAAEPALNAWVARLLPDPARIRIEATFLDPRSREPLATLSTRLNQFFLSPLDAVYLAGAAGPGSALESLMAYRLLRHPPQDVPHDAVVTFGYERGADWPTEDVEYRAFLETVRAVRDLVASTRPLDARDFEPQEVMVAPNSDHAELKSRADTAVNAFENARNHLVTELERHETETIELDSLRAAIFRMVWLGIPEAIPQHAAGDPPEARRVLLDQARSALEETDRRMATLRAAEAAVNRSQATPEEQVKHDLARLQTIFGADFRVLPRFVALDPETLEATFADSPHLQQDPAASVEWFLQVAYVRDAVARLKTCLTYAETLSADAGMSFTVGQLPHRADDRWIALPFDPSSPPAAPCTSLVAMLPKGYRAAEPAAGLMIDEWVDALPSPRETAGVAFHFDAPAVQAPQAILLAVPPDERPQWDLETLEAIVQDTLELARLRTVDAAALAEDPDHGHFLPALYLAFNPAGDTVSTDFSFAARF